MCFKDILAHKFGINIGPDDSGSDDGQNGGGGGGTLSGDDSTINRP